MIRTRVYVLLLLCALLHLVSCGTYRSIHHVPKTESYNNIIPVVVQHSDSSYSYHNNTLFRNKQQQWELYVEGDPLERGLITGALTEKLILIQEQVFIDKVNEIVPSKFKQSLLRQFLKWYNRKLYLHVNEEFKTEIYGISRYSSNDYDYVAPPYLRSLYLHAAHDIGHALTDLSLVQCTSFAAWGDKTSDGSLLVARNLDFYAGDEFAENKIIAFVKPDSGYPFMSVTWGGMIGALSGMNLEGLTVTINSGKSDTPLVAKTPISLLAREILQYAKNIDEAVAIAKNREVFVSENIMIGSANDGRAVIIEVSPKKLGVYEVMNSNQLICSNHFQSEVYKDDKNNAEAISESHSQYRYDRVKELLSEENKVTPVKAAAILRNREGRQDVRLGYGNEKAINQLLAHHGIVFKPEQRLVWVSSNPYQLGEFVAYDLNKIFSKPCINGIVESMSKPELNIERDPFADSQAFADYEEYRKQERIVEKAIANDQVLPSGILENYIQLNPDFWKVYYNAGKYYYNKGYYTAANAEFKLALTKEITTLPSKQKVEEYLEKIKCKLD